MLLFCTVSICSMDFVFDLIIKKVNISRISLRRLGQSENRTEKKKKKPSVTTQANTWTLLRPTSGCLNITPSNKRKRWTNTDTWKGFIARVSPHPLQRLPLESLPYIFLRKKWGLSDIAVCLSEEEVGTIGYCRRSGDCRTIEALRLY